MRKHWTGVVCLVAVVGGLSACGGGGSSTGGTAAGTGITKRAYARQADAICRAGIASKNAALRATFAELAPGSRKYATRQAQEELVRTVVLGPFERMAREVADLPPPESETARVRSMARLLDRGVERMSEHPGLALTNEEALFGRWNAAARAYGMRVCSHIR
ncbi:MAG: hypothetical protein U0R71_09105 [Solirubrobacterales bacterium]